jgi:hypothetical protein
MGIIAGTPFAYLLKFSYYSLLQLQPIGSLEKNLRLKD